jgi:hypothetical protein
MRTIYRWLRSALFGGLCIAMLAAMPAAHAQDKILLVGWAGGHAGKLTDEITLLLTQRARVENIATADIDRAFEQLQGGGRVALVMSAGVSDANPTELANIKRLQALRPVAHLYEGMLAPNTQANPRPSAFRVVTGLYVAPNAPADWVIDLARVVNQAIQNYDLRSQGVKVVSGDRVAALAGALREMEKPTLWLWDHTRTNPEKTYSAPVTATPAMPVAQPSRVLVAGISGSLTGLLARQFAAELGDPNATPIDYVPPAGPDGAADFLSAGGRRVALVSLVVANGSPDEMRASRRLLAATPVALVSEPIERTASGATKRWADGIFVPQNANEAWLAEVRAAAARALAASNVMQYRQPSARGGNAAALQAVMREIAVGATVSTASSAATTNAPATASAASAARPGIAAGAPNVATPSAPANAGVVGAAGKGSNWPVGMEAGNLYFIYPDHSRRPEVPVMVAARSRQEAIERIYSAYEAERAKNDNHKYFPEGRFSVMPEGECVGPSWGATVSNYGDNRKFMWGGGCGKTPALAIEAAFAACARRVAEGCNNRPGGGWGGPSIHLALSGTTSWSGTYCPLGASCDPGTHSSFGSMNAWTNHYTRGRSYVNDMADSINKLGRECDAGSDPSRQCFVLSNNLRCHFETPIPQIGKLCTDSRLTRNGYSGPLRAPR